MATPAKMVNHYRCPRALFVTSEKARSAACSVNDRTRTMKASYKRVGDRLWEVTAPGVTLPVFLEAIAGSDFLTSF